MAACLLLLQLLLSLEEGLYQQPKHLRSIAAAAAAAVSW
jgi:hypothetical protein